jgi:hypothetical protein
MTSINTDWLENMKKVRFRWETTYLDHLHWGTNFMPEEMGFIYWKIGTPDQRLPYRNRGYFETVDGDIVKMV